ncbi:SURF1 family protein [Yimella sp. cx-573]|nr:SURF1 family protein [Yimella sp. cx-573]
MFRLLLTRRWVGWMLVALLAATACVFLGRWQYHRYEHKITAEKHLEANYNGAPVDIASAQPNALVPPDAEQQWRQVRLTGTYLDSNRVLIRNRPLAKSYGYEVVVPLRTTGGEVVFVDRGWIPNGRTAAAPDSVPPTPTGPVTVIGWLRAGEPDLKRADVPGQAASINVALLRELTTQPQARNAYVLMRSENAANLPKVAPAALPKPDPGGYAWINFSYAVQWWIGAAGVLAFFLLRARREHLDATQEPRPSVPKQKKEKVRIWDEEDD